MVGGLSDLGRGSCRGEGDPAQCRKRASIDEVVICWSGGVRIARVSRITRVSGVAGVFRERARDPDRATAARVPVDCDRVGDALSHLERNPAGQAVTRVVVADDLRERAERRAGVYGEQGVEARA